MIRMQWPGEPRSARERLARDTLWLLRQSCRWIVSLGRRGSGRWLRRRHNEPVRLHVGCGERRLEGWVNIDIEPLPGVDLVADVTRGLRFRAVDAVFAEHFLEHLAVDEAIRFLLEVHRVLRDGGTLRLSTPNLEWVWATHLGAGTDDPTRATLNANRAFFGWGHRFIWSRDLLTEVLQSCGFRKLRWCRYGESEIPALEALEGHVTCGDSDEQPHVLVVEATRGTEQPERLDRLIRLVQSEFLHHTERAYSRRYWKDAWWADRKRRREGETTPP